MDVLRFNYREYLRYMAPDITDDDILRLSGYVPRFDAFRLRVLLALKAFANG